MTEAPQVIGRHLPEVWKIRYGDLDSVGWNVRLRHKFDYYTPDEWYAAALAEYVTPQTKWLDVGCGRHILPQNPQLAETLAKRCSFLFGIDPSENVEQNPLLHARQRSTVEDFHTDDKFDLITMRMVAEHITNPEKVISILANLLRPGGRVIVYTVWKWAPVSIVAAITPMAVHHKVKKILWNAEERDTFPVAYAMNTRSRLNALMKSNGLLEEHFLYLDDCRSFQRWKLLSTAELGLRRALNSIGAHYPELCLLAIYRRTR